MKRLLLLLFISFSFMGTSSADYRKAKKAYDKGDINTAYDECNKHEERENPLCHGLLGRMQNEYYYSTLDEQKDLLEQIPSNAHVSGSDRRTSSQIASDALFHKQLSEFVKSDYKTRDSNLNFLVYNNSVTVAGEVPSKEIQSYVLGNIQILSPNIKQIYNEMTIGPVSGALSRLKDSSITELVVAQFQNQEVFHPTHVRVMTENQTVYLMGAVIEREGSMAGKAAAKARGVKKVVKMFDYLEAIPDSKIEKAEAKINKLVIVEKHEYEDTHKVDKKIPLNAYASGSGWLCHSGYTKSGNKCVINIPPNAFAYGTGWLCNPGYNHAGNKCVINIPPNAYNIPPNAYASGSGWLCNSGYLKKGLGCEKLNTYENTLSKRSTYKKTNSQGIFYKLGQMLERLGGNNQQYSSAFPASNNSLETFYSPTILEDFSYVRGNEIFGTGGQIGNIRGVNIYNNSNQKIGYIKKNSNPYSIHKLLVYDTSGRYISPLGKNYKPKKVNFFNNNNSIFNNSTLFNNNNSIFNSNNYLTNQSTSFDNSIFNSNNYLTNQSTSFDNSIF